MSEESFTHVLLVILWQVSAWEFLHEHEFGEFTACVDKQIDWSSKELSHPNNWRGYSTA